MKTILHLSSSLDLGNSASREIGALVVSTLTGQHPGLSVVRRDLARDPVPQIAPEFFESLATAPTEPPEASRELIAELLAADLLVIESPMYNFGIPSSLKAWIDQVVRPGLTFTMTGGERRGLLGRIGAILVLASGGVYSTEETRSLDHQEPYLRGILGYIGITEIETIRIEGTAFGPDARAQALARARDRVDGAVSRWPALR